MNDLADIQFDAEPEPTQPQRASERSLKYMRDLARERDTAAMLAGMPDNWRHYYQKALVSDQAAQSDVSKFIDQLKKQPRKTLPGTNIPVQTRATNALEDGVYQLPPNAGGSPDGGTIYKVYHTVHGANVQVAKELVPHQNTDGIIDSWEFQYRGRAPLHYIKPEHKLSLDEAREFGELYGVCCCCGRTLTNELSIALGIGPICGDREFGGEFTIIRDAKKQELGL